MKLSELFTSNLFYRMRTPLYHASVYWIIRNDEWKILISLRGKDMYDFAWRYQFPSGHMDGKETIFEALKREIHEWILFNDFQVTYTKTIHSPESIAYRFTQWAKSIVITWDCDYDETLIDFSKETDILVIECSFPNDMKVAGHVVSQECWEIGKKANVWKLVLTHLYPLKKELRLDEARKIFPNTILAEDLLTIEI